MIWFCESPASGLGAKQESKGGVGIWTGQGMVATMVVTCIDGGDENKQKGMP